MSVDLTNLGPAGQLRFAGRRSRSVISDAVGAIRYPSPFFDLGSMYLPSSFKTMLRWCRYYFLTNPIIHAAVYKMAEYPVTDLIYDTENDTLRKKWQYLFDNVFQFKKFEVEAGLDYQCYGNAFVSIYYPFHKYLKCRSCGRLRRVTDAQYVFREFKFVGTCSCGHYGPFKVVDQPIRSIRDLRLIRWNPEYITIHHNEATGESKYYYTIPPVLANDIRMGKRHVIESIPQAFIEALRTNKALLFSSDNIYHMKRPTIAQKDKGWGMPMILPVLKHTFYLQILQKAQEAIAIEHIVPLRVLFPQTPSASADVYSTINLAKWRNKIEQEIMRWRVDNNYIPIMPLPVGQQTLGGDGRALMLAQEYRVWAEQIVAGMGVPVEFVFGGMQYSGSNVSLRMLENHFLDQKAHNLRFVRDFVIDNVAAYMGWEPIDVHYRRFKMADDLQRSAFNLQLNQAGKLSDKSMLEENDWDSKLEAERIAKEKKEVLEQQRQQAIGQASIQGEAQMLLQKYQMRAQKQMMEAQAEGQPPMDPQASMQMQEMGMQMAGQPGVSPTAMGQMGNTQMGMMNQAGMIPPVAQNIPQAPGGAEGAAQGAPQDAQMAAQQPQAMPQEAQSPLSAEQPTGAGPLHVVVQKIVAMLDQMPENEQQQHLQTLSQTNPQLYTLVAQALSSRQGAHANSNAMPQPEQKPARRGPEAQMV